MKCVVFGGTNASGKKTLAAALFQAGLFGKEWDVVQSNSLGKRVWENETYEEKILIFCATESCDVNANFLRTRVESGAKDIPKEKLERVREEGFKNLVRSLGEFDHIFLIDNSRRNERPRLVCSIQQGKRVYTSDKLPRWITPVIAEHKNASIVSWEHRKYLLSIDEAIREWFLPITEITWEEKVNILRKGGWPRFSQTRERALEICRRPRRRSGLYKFA